jgi:hypothetical protein
MLSMMKTKTKPELSNYQVVKVKGKGRLIYKSFGPELKGIYQLKAHQGHILNSIVFTW